MTDASRRAIARNPAVPGRSGRSCKSCSTAASTEPAAGFRGTAHHRRDVRSTASGVRPAVARLQATCSGPR